MTGTDQLALLCRVMEGYGVDVVLIGIPHGPPVSRHAVIKLSRQAQQQNPQKNQQFPAVTIFVRQVSPPNRGGWPVGVAHTDDLAAGPSPHEELPPVGCLGYHARSCTLRPAT